MLEQIRIRGLGVIDDAELELGPGLTVLTGETGAGKTMVLTGLGLLLGGRADPGAVRPEGGRATVEGRVRVDPAGGVASRVIDAGGDLDGDGLLLGRTVTAEGRSRAYAGGRAVPASLLGDLGDDLMVVHGQRDHVRLLRPAAQRTALDRLAGPAVESLLGDYGARFTRLQQVEGELAEVAARARERMREADLLRFGLDEIQRVDPKPGEDLALAAEEARLAHADGLRTAAEAARTALAAEESAAPETDVGLLVAAARRALDQQRHHDPEAAALADRLAEVAYLVADVSADLASYAAGIEADPVRLAAVQERRAALTGLSRKYGDDVDAVLAWARAAADRLTELDDDGPRTQALRAERDALRAELAGLAADLSLAREATGARLADEVTAELAALAMRHGRLEVAIRRRADPEGLEIDGKRLAFGPTGVDDVELLFAAHDGAAARPLDRGASGGELSRLMLAVAVVLGAADPVPTMVFDEVDAGVGGRAAVEVGRRLARLAGSCQVLVVTHLPQVAAFADQHLRVVKSEDGTVSRSGVKPLDDTGRVRELSRMLAGLEGSATATAHAEELLAAAAASKPLRATDGPTTG